MKKLILTILASSFLLSCSTDSASDDSNNPTGNGLLLKTLTDDYGTTTLNYSGNKATYFSDSDGSTSNFTYNGDLIIRVEQTGGSGSNFINTYNYSNNLLTSSTENRNSTNSSSNYNSTYTYNSDGSITEIITGTNTYNGNTTNSTEKNVLFYSQGNCVKVENYTFFNGVYSLNETIIYTYDNKNSPFKNITGLYNAYYPTGNINVNNCISQINKNDSGEITYTAQTAYQYNAQNFPISETTTETEYTFNPQTGTSTPGTPQSLSPIIYTYY
ncbi:hypothetical protein [Flavobacterium sp.]|jgi:hypothetical protein|uniref:hypothetical protein n=1 Tax=Flavobacterium sp. TaxID=239 RepID=UPI0037C13FC3